MVCFQILPKLAKTHSYTHKFYHIPMELSREIGKISTLGQKVFSQRDPLLTSLEHSDKIEYRKGIFPPPLLCERQQHLYNHG